jgi:hypothetical protein
MEHANYVIKDVKDVRINFKHSVFPVWQITISQILNVTKFVRIIFMEIL